MRKLVRMDTQGVERVREVQHHLVDLLRGPRGERRQAGAGQIDDVRNHIHEARKHDALAEPDERIDHASEHIDDDAHLQGAILALLDDRSDTRDNDILVAAPQIFPTRKFPDIPRRDQPIHLRTEQRSVLLGRLVIAADLHFCIVFVQL
jgi:hypothetical protein